MSSVMCEVRLATFIFVVLLQESVVEEVMDYRTYCWAIAKTFCWAIAISR